MFNNFLCNCNNNDLINFQLENKYFPYLDFSKINNSRYNKFNTSLEFLELSNTYDNFDNFFKMNGIESVFYDEFLDCKTEETLYNLDEYFTYFENKNKDLSNDMDIIDSENPVEDVNLDLMVDIYDC